MSFQGAVCPQCGQIDAVRKVSSVVSEGNTTTQQFGLAPNLTGRSFYLIGTQGTSTTDLAMRLSPQGRRPGAVGLRIALALLSLLAGGVLAIGLSLFAVTPEFGLFACGNWVVGILAVTAVFTVLPLLGIPQAIRKQERYDAALNRARVKWTQLYYCARDDIVFDPGRNVPMPIHDLDSYLYNEA